MGINKYVSELKRMAEAEGCSVGVRFGRRSLHLDIEIDGRFITTLHTSITPSDRRSALNLRALLRRAVSEARSQARAPEAT